NYGATTIWVSHTVLGGAGSRINWYEVNTATGGLAQSGSVSSASLYLLNAGISTDRTCTDTTCAHGEAMVLGFTTTSKKTFPAIARGRRSAPALVNSVLDAQSGTK